MQIIKTIDSRFYRELGKEIRRLRDEKRITLSDMSKSTGFSRTLLDNWELGLNKIKPDQFETICEALQVTNNVGIIVKIGF